MLGQDVEVVAGVTEPDAKLLPADSLLVDAQPLGARHHLVSLWVHHADRDFLHAAVLHKLQVVPHGPHDRRHQAAGHVVLHDRRDGGEGRQEDQAANAARGPQGREEGRGLLELAGLAVRVALLLQLAPPCLAGDAVRQGRGGSSADGAAPEDDLLRLEAHILDAVAPRGIRHNVDGGDGWLVALQQAVARELRTEDHRVAVQGAVAEGCHVLNALADVARIRVEVDDAIRD
mmetsp:Transcript_85431/g.226878  ORF Transcript_85431/g.226878 Transcript_85431/m.226878 type:complete len:232 (+) Transcript_85431:290-985(+)